MIAAQHEKQVVAVGKRAGLIWAFAMLATLFLGCPMFGQSTARAPGIKVGEKIPSIAANDQFGHPQTFESLRGKQGLLVLFSRSADWCPYCKRHLLQLQQAKAEFEAKGIHVASITYDSEAILKEFSARKGITYPMLSDPGSKIIRAFAILNPEVLSTVWNHCGTQPESHFLSLNSRRQCRYTATRPCWARISSLQRLKNSMAALGVARQFALRAHSSIRHVMTTSVLCRYSSPETG